MPAKPQPLKAIEPDERPEGIPDGLWAFPRNLAEEANARGWSQKRVAKCLGVSQSTISRWLSYKGIRELKVSDVIRLEEELGLRHGELTLAPLALRERVRGIEVETHSSLPPAATEDVRDRASKVTTKPLAQPRRRSRAKSNHP